MPNVPRGAPGRRAAPYAVPGRRAVVLGAVVRIQPGVLYDSRALAELFGITESGVKTRRRRGQLPPAVRIGGRLRWEGSVILAWLSQHTEGAAPGGATPAEPTARTVRPDRTRAVTTAARRNGRTLSPDDVTAIRAALSRGERQTALAKQYRVTPGQISHIARARVWREIGGGS